MGTGQLTINNYKNMATTKKQTKKRLPSHALFWALLKETPGYDPRYKEVIKEGLVYEHLSLIHI